MRSSTRRQLVLSVLGPLLAASVARAQQRPLTVEWIFGPEARAATSVPVVAWLRDGKALVGDFRRPVAERTLELLDPRTGERRAALDRALANLREALGEQAPADFRWPLAFDPAGRYAVYVLEGDVVLLELPGAGVHRVTDTGEKETAVTVSPDGTRLAYVRGNDLYAFDVAQGKETRLTTDGSVTTRNVTLSWIYWEEVFGRRDTAYWWSPDSRAIAYLQADESGVPESYFVDFEPARPRVLRQRYPKTGEANPAVRLGIVRAGGGPTTWAGLTAGSYEYLVRVAWSPGAERVAVQTLNRGQDRLELLFVDPGTGAASRVLEETDPAWVNFYDGPYFVGNGEPFLWISERSDHAHLYRYTTRGELLNAVTSGDWSLSPAGAFASYSPPSVLGVDAKRGWAYFTAAEKNPLEQHVYRVGLDGRGLRRLSDEPGFHVPSFSPDLRHYVDEYSSLTRPSTLSLHRADGRGIGTLGGSAPDFLARMGLRAPELLTIPTADSFPLPARILRPAGFDPQRRYPVILNVYGGPSSPTVVDAWSYDVLFDQLLVENGFLVASVDNRSSTGGSQKLERLIDHQMYGDVELGDLLAAVRWLKSQPYVDPQRIGIWGWSGGGSYTLLGMTSSEEFKAGIAVAPLTDQSFYDTRWSEFAMERPQDNPQGYAKASLVRRAKDLHGRLLLVHGTYDDNVHIQSTWAFANQLIEAGKTFEMMIYPMRKHGIEDTPATIHLYKTMLEFWKERL